jgi:hypothetical protein
MEDSSDMHITNNNGQNAHGRFVADTVDGDPDRLPWARSASEARTGQPNTEDVRGSSSRSTRDESSDCQEEVNIASSCGAESMKNSPVYVDLADELVGPDLATALGADDVNPVYEVGRDRGMDVAAREKSQSVTDECNVDLLRDGSEFDSHGRKLIDSNGGQNTGVTQNDAARTPSSIVKSTWSQTDQLSSSHVSPFSRDIDASKYPPSCIVKLPPGASHGDQLVIRWPRRSTTVACKTGDDKGSKRNLSDDDCPSEGDTDILVKVIVPKRIKSKIRSDRHLAVFAPWITAERAAMNTLTARQLRSIGIDGHDGCNAILRRSRRQRIRNHGEGNFSTGHSRIGDRYQVSADQIPCATTWGKERMARSESMGCEGDGAAENSAVAKYDQIWDVVLSEEAIKRGEPVDKYLELLDTYQKARGLMALHRFAYKVTSSEQWFHKLTATKIPFPDKLEPSGWKCEKPHSMLEGIPLSKPERTTFNEAIQEYRKQWPKIAKAVGTSVNRCLIHYYSTYKAGEGHSYYLQVKKLWEQSDECEVCHDGGDLICCDGCIHAYHMTCIALKEVPVGQWFCPECEQKVKI